MIGSTRSSTKRRTLSRTARSSSERRLSMLKKSSMGGTYRVRPPCHNQLWPDARRSGAAPGARRADAAMPTSRAFARKPAPWSIGAPGLVLPLMHHLVQQRVQRLVPAVAAQCRQLIAISPGSPALRRRVVAEPALHAARHANRNGLQRAAEMLGVVPLVPLGELRSASGSSSGRVRSRRDRPARRRRPNATTIRRCAARRSARVRPSTNCDDRLVHLVGAREVALVHAQLVAAEAHHHVAVPRQPARADALEAQARAAARAARRRCAARRVELERRAAPVAAGRRRTDFSARSISPDRRRSRAGRPTRPASTPRSRRPRS